MMSVCVVLQCSVYDVSVCCVAVFSFRCLYMLCCSVRFMMSVNVVLQCSVNGSVCCVAVFNLWCQSTLSCVAGFSLWCQCVLCCSVQCLQQGMVCSPLRMLHLWPQDESKVSMVTHSATGNRQLCCPCSSTCLYKRVKVLLASNVGSKLKQVSCKFCKDSRLQNLEPKPKQPEKEKKTRKKNKQTGVSDSIRLT